MAELYACQKLNLNQMPSGNQGFDAIDQNGRKYQIKGRSPDRRDTVDPGGTVGRFVNFNFDYGLLVLIDGDLECREIWRANVGAIKIDQGKLRNDKSGIRIFKFQEIGEKITPNNEKSKENKKSQITKGPLFGGCRSAVKILDSETGKIYGSMYACGRDLAQLVGRDRNDHFAYYKLAKLYPGRFKELR